MKRYIDDILVVAGCALIVYASYCLSPIAAMFVGGVFLIAAGFALGRSLK